MPRTPFDPATDYYQLLGVGPHASAEEIQAAYRRLAKANHPDLNAGSAVAAARMAGLNVAKSVLLDRDTRADLASRANNFILARSDSTPESELLRADGRRLVHSANAGDTAGWEAAVADVCQLAGRC